MAQGAAWLSGFELFSQARTDAYIRLGLGGPYLSPGGCECCADLSLDLDGTQLYYASPASDPAPWYSAAEPASGEFLGVLATIEGLGSTLSRTVQPRTSGRGGGRMSRLHPKERQMPVHGHIVASSDRGQEFGLRWLTATAAGQGLNCDGCRLDELVVQLACPGEGDDLCAQRWALRDVGLLSGPTPGSGGSGGGGASCAELRPFDMVLVSEHPYLYSTCDPTCLELSPISLPASGACVPFCDWWGPFTPVSCVLAPPSFPDDLAAVVTIVAGDRPVSVDVTASAGSCPPSGSARYAVIPVRGLPAGATMVIDSASERIAVTLATGVVTDGFRYVRLDADTPFDWLTVGCDGGPSCVSVEGRVCSVNYGTRVKIDAIRRRL